MTIINRNGLKISNQTPAAAGGSLIIANFVSIADRLQINTNFFKTISITNTPPISAAIGDTYLVSTSPVSAFAGQSNSVACWSYRYDYPYPQMTPDVLWRFTTPTTGDFLYDNATSTKYLYRNNQWTITGDNPGDIKTSAYSSVPAGWLNCDGNTVAVSAYQNLFNKIGYTYGGSGSTFKTPDLQARMPIGKTVGAMTVDISGRTLTTRSLGQMSGEEVHLLDTTEMPSHNHSYQEPSGNAPGSPGGGGYDSTSTTNTSNTGGGAVHNNMPPFTVISYIIKY
jgi:microcystin-dependent protein